MFSFLVLGSLASIYFSAPLCVHFLLSPSLSSRFPQLCVPGSFVCLLLDSKTSDGLSWFTSDLHVYKLACGLIVIAKMYFPPHVRISPVFFSVGSSLRHWHSQYLRSIDIDSEPPHQLALTITKTFCPLSSHLASGPTAAHCRFIA